MYRIAVVGCGYWGPNFIRIFTQLPDSEVKYCCDLNEDRLAQMRLLYPHVHTTTRLEDVLEDPKVDGVVVATTTTAPDGSYGFTGVPAGSGYTIRLRQQHGGRAHRSDGAVDPTQRHGDHRRGGLPE